MNLYDKMMTYLDGVYFDLLDKNRLGSDYHFDDSWVEDLIQFEDLDTRITTIITNLENRDYTTAMLYVQDMLDNDQTKTLEAMESGNVAYLSPEEIGNL